MRNFIILTMVLVFVQSVVFAQESMQVDGKKRDYVVYAPSGLGSNPPLILALHPLGGTSSQFKQMSGWNTFADKDKFVVVYPQGITTITMNGQDMIGWDIAGDSDVHFITSIIDTMAARYKIDRNRVYSTGFSMGGMLSYVLACRVAGMITAIGSDAGYPMGQNASSCKPTVPVAICHVHGGADDFVTYSGVEAWIKRFAGLNNCQQSPVSTTPSTKYSKEDWTPCENGIDVVFYTITGMGHNYATSSQNGFSATDTFYNFFKTHIRSSTGIITEKRANDAQTPLIFSAVCSGGVLQIGIDSKINSIQVFDVRGKTIYASKKLNRQAGKLIIHVGHSSNNICMIKADGSNGSSVKRVLLR